MTPERSDDLAILAGVETNECFPSDTPWRRRFVELLMADAERENAALCEALSYYADSANYRREVHNVGPRINWVKPSVCFDRGARARFFLMTLEEGK